MEITLTNVAKTTQEGLLINHLDFLRNHNLAEWERNHRLSIRMTELIRNHPIHYDTLRKGIEHPDPEICVNALICLIKVTKYLLNRQIKHLETKFLEEGGIRERMTKARLNRRKQQQ